MQCEIHVRPFQTGLCMLLNQILSDKKNATVDVCSNNFDVANLGISEMCNNCASERRYCLRIFGTQEHGSPHRLNTLYVEVHKHTSFDKLHFVYARIWVNHFMNLHARSCEAE